MFVSTLHASYFTVTSGLQVMGSSSEYKVKPLTRGGKYHVWACKFHALMVEKDLEVYLEEDPAENASAEEKRKAKKCKARLLMAVDGPLVQIVNNCDTAKEAWEALKSDHVGGLATRRPLLLSEMRNLKQKTGESVVDYSDRAMELMQQLEDQEIESADALLTDAYIQGLIPSLMLACLPVVSPKVDMGFEAVVNDVKSICRLLPVAAGRDKTQAHEGTMLGAEGNKKRKETRRCHNCGKKGHIKKDCWLLQKQNDQSNDRGNGAVLLARATPSTGFARTELTAKQQGRLLLDSGATHHIVNVVDPLFDCKPSEVRDVVVGDGTSLKVLCEGKVSLSGGPDGTVTLTQVLCVPEMGCNVISVPTLADKGCDVSIGQASATVTGPAGRVLLVAPRAGRCYEINASMKSSAQDTYGAAFVADASTELIHKRWAHPGKEVTEKIAKEQGVSTPKMQDCVVCAGAKLTRGPFPPSVSKAVKPLELVHSDLMGPFPTLSVGGARYVLTILDDASRYSAICCIKSKADVPDMLIKTLVEWQTQTDSRLKVLRTDNGTEYKGKLHKWCADHGVIHQLSAEYTPEQNGRIERLHRTLKEKARAMLLQHDLPPPFWAAAFDTACYLRNRLPVHGQESVPYEAFFRKNAGDHNDIRVFGCLCYMHIPQAKRRRPYVRDNKVSAVAKPGIFTGYEANSKAWRVYVWENNKFVSYKSRNVRFFEDIRPTAVLECMRAGSVPYVSTDFLYESEDDVEGFEPEGSEAAQTLAGAEALQSSETVLEGLDTVQDTQGEDPGSAEQETDGSVAGQAAHTAPETDSEGDANVDTDAGAGGGRYPIRDRRAPERYHYTAYMNMVEWKPNERPRSLRAALAGKDGELWEKARVSEANSLIKLRVYDTWDISQVPEGKKIIPTQALCDIREDEKGKIVKYKVRLVVVGCRQIAGVDYDESQLHAPTALQASVRTLLAYAAEHN